MKRDGNGVGLVVLLISVLLLIYFALTSASKELNELTQTQDQIDARQEEVQEMGETMQGIKTQIEDGYDNLDKQIADE
ncbi:MAG: hypothetical protein K6B69_04630 [Lachnospiraceae bacterium]|nr:hypothetical protein [Lachnospiraceae bacterium]